MKTHLLKLTFLFLATLFSLYANAQSRIKNNYHIKDVIKTIPLQKKAVETFLPFSISGYYFEGFENTFPPAGWQVVDVLDTTYTWSTSVLADYPAAYEGATSAYIHYDFAGGAGGEDWLIAPKFTVAAGDSLSFQFKFEYVGYLPDSTFILVSTTDSSLSSFTNVIDYIADTSTVQDTAGLVWHYKTYSLNAFSGQDIYIAFKNKNILGDGVFIDNVEIGTRPAAEAAAISIDMDEFYPSGISTPKASVKNYGGTSQTFNVIMTISGGYTSTKSVTVSPQATSQISFDPWNATVGNYTINVQTLLAGDANPANDTLSSSIKVLETFVNYGWSTHDPLVIPTFGSGVASVNFPSNSRLFVLGGYGNLTIIPDAFDYDLSFNTWASIAPMANECTFAASATANGKVFVFGGRTLTTAAGPTQIYDYVTDTWTTGTSMPFPVLNAAFAMYKDSLVYIMGGTSDTSILAFNNVQIYNAYTDSWSSGTAIPGIPLFASRAGIVNNKIVFAGGYDPVTTTATGATYVGEIDTLNPNQITWTQVADHPAGKISRQASGVSVDKNSSLVIFAGGSIADQTTNVTAETFAYDVNSNSWKLGPHKPTPRNYFYMAPIIFNDSVYLAAPGGNPGSFFHSAEYEWLNLGPYQFPTSLSENNFITDLKLFPNPSADLTMLSLNLKKATQVIINLSDVTGKSIVQVCDKIVGVGKNTIAIPTKNLAPGIYFCVINVDGRSLTKKLVKN